MASPIAHSIVTQLGALARSACHSFPENFLIFNIKGEKKMKKEYIVQVNDEMTPVKVMLTESEAEAVAYVLKEVVASDPDALVGIEDDDGNELYSNYDEWAKTHRD
jgi:hypothetical protein